MQKYKSGKVVGMLMVFVMMFGMLGTSVFAASTDDRGISLEQLQKFNTLPLEVAGKPSLETDQLASKVYEKIDPNKKAGIALKKSVKAERSIVTNAVYDVSGALMDFNDSLQFGDSNDLWFFSVNTDRSMVLKLLSANSDYVAQLFIVDWSTGQAYPTSVGAYAQTQIALKNLPAGDYLLQVYSVGNVGDSYTLRMNATNPANYSSITYTTDSLNIVMASYPNGDVYSSGTLIYNSQSKGSFSNLDWKRVDEFSWGSGYEQRTHEIYNAKVQSISAPVRYSSRYASSSNAILIYLDKGTGFMSHASFYQSGPDHVYESTFLDTLGRLTPRYLDADDIENWGSHILIYDLNTNKAIDFYSVLNYYYAAGIEPQPVVQFLTNN